MRNPPRIWYVLVLISCSSIPSSNSTVTEGSQAINVNTGSQVNSNIVSGHYNDGWDFKLALNPKTNTVYGKFYAQQNRNNMTYYCSEYFIGFKDQDTLRLTRIDDLYTHQNDTINEFEDKMYHSKIFENFNVIKWKATENSLDAHCWRTIPLAQSEEGMSMYLDTNSTKPWIEIQIAKEKTYFYTDTLDALPRKAFIQKFDAFCVIADIGNWYYGEYVGEKSTTKGWLRKEHFYQIPYIERKYF